MTKKFPLVPDVCKQLQVSADKYVVLLLCSN